MSSMKPRSFDDYAAFFSLAQLHGYPVALAWNQGGRPAQPARRRSALALVRKAFPRPAARVAETQPCMT
jgi:hypothetical protein